MSRVINFSAGPSMLPLEVLKQAQDEFVDYQGMGFGIMEISHRSKVFDDVYHNTIDSIRKLYSLNDDYEVLFFQGGASLQFAMIPMNLILPNKPAEYANTGVWTQKAIKEAKIQNANYKIIASSEDSGFNHIPQVHFSDEASYGYICSNNTIYGTQYQKLPVSKAPLIIDASSDVLSKPIDFVASNIGFLYAGAQKNAGIAGVALGIIRRDLLQRSIQSVPTMLKYSTYANNDSMFNTPPTFSIYILGLVARWLDSLGGLEAVNKRNNAKAKLIYDAIDSSSGFYVGYADKNSRSIMNISFNIAGNPSLEPIFVEEAAKEGMIGLKGHKHIGGIRASIYNAVDLKQVQMLVDFMQEFARKHG